MLWPRNWFNIRFPSSAVCARDLRLALLAIIVGLVSGCTTVKPAPTPSVTVVQSRVTGANPSLAPYFVTVHVLLQVHEHPNEEARATQDRARVSACQERVVADGVRLAESGVRAIVAEGIYAEGSLNNPVSVRATQGTETTSERAVEILAARSDVAVYGFEMRSLNEFGVSVVNQLGSSARRALELAKDGLGISEPGIHEEVKRLIQDESTRLTLWYAGVVPERSFLALNTALAVALARRENQVQLIIGKAHWGDLVYAIDRHQDVRLRLVPHPCE